MAHKFLARIGGCWAEFRADPSGLKQTPIGILVLSLWSRSVMVVGNITGANGNSVSGPISNLVLYAIGLVIGGSLLGSVMGQLFYCISMALGKFNSSRIQYDSFRPLRWPESKME